MIFKQYQTILLFINKGKMKKEFEIKFKYNNLIRGK